MGDVVEFKPRDDQDVAECLQCECGCMSFIMLATGQVECAGCGNEPPCVWEWDVEGLDI